MKRSLGTDTLLTPAPVWVISSYDKDNNPNAMTASWAGISCSNPPCVNVSLRSATYSHSNILFSKAFAINIPSQCQVKEADAFGMFSGRDINKIEKAGMTAEKSEVVNAPYIKEFPIVVECDLVNVYEAGIHTVFTGEIKNVLADEEVLDASGLPDTSKIKPFVFAPGSRKYYALGEEIGKAFSIGKTLNDNIKRI